MRAEGCLITIKQYYDTYAYYLLIPYDLAYAIDNKGDDHAAKYKAKYDDDDDHMLGLASRFTLWIQQNDNNIIINK